MAGSCAWQLRLGQAGWLKRGEEVSSWHQSFTFSPQTIRTSRKSSSNSKFKFFQHFKTFQKFNKVCLVVKSLQIFKSVTLEPT
jgi:hypothetical protein